MPDLRLLGHACRMCGARATTVAIDGTWRAAVCDEHIDATWETWRAQRHITHPPRPPRSQG